MPETIQDRFFDKVVALDDEDGGCWQWIGTLTDRGYGRFHIDNHVGSKRIEARAHRWSYQHFVGEIPSGKQIDHTCRNRACCNPDHLEAVTSRENTLRGQGPAGLHAQKTHCKNDHPLSGENLYTYTKPNGLVMRGCKQCRNAAERARRRALGGFPLETT